MHGKDPSLDKDWLYQYCFVASLGGEVWHFDEVRLHARPLRIKTHEPSTIALDDMVVLLEIHHDFGHDHSLPAKVTQDENALIYYGIFPVHEWRDDMSNSSKAKEPIFFYLSVDNSHSYAFSDMYCQDDLLSCMHRNLVAVTSWGIGYSLVPISIPAPSGIPPPSSDHALPVKLEVEITDLTEDITSDHLPNTERHQIITIQDPEEDLAQSLDAAVKVERPFKRLHRHIFPSSSLSLTLSASREKAVLEDSDPEEATFRGKVPHGDCFQP